VDESANFVSKASHKTSCNRVLERFFRTNDPWERLSVLKFSFRAVTPSNCFNGTVPTMSAQDSLSVDFLIPFGDEEWPGLRVSFHRRLPIGQENGIVKIRGEFRATFWFEKDNIYVLRHSLREDVSKWNDLPVGKVHVTVSIKQVSEELARFILERGKLNGASDPNAGCSQDLPRKRRHRATIFSRRSA
jgi:hypothetical protein